MRGFAASIGVSLLLLGCASTPPARPIAIDHMIIPAVAEAGGPVAAYAGFDTAGAPSLAWGGKGWNQARADYDLDALVARTADTPLDIMERLPGIAEHRERLKIVEPGQERREAYEPYRRRFDALCDMMFPREGSL